MDANPLEQRPHGRLRDQQCVEKATVHAKSPFFAFVIEINSKPRKVKLGAKFLKPITAPRIVMQIALNLIEVMFA